MAARSKPRINSELNHASERESIHIAVGGSYYALQPIGGRGPIEGIVDVEGEPEILEHTRARKVVSEEQIHDVERSDVSLLRCNANTGIQRVALRMIQARFGM
jgi:hypothetical protein